MTSSSSTTLGFLSSQNSLFSTIITFYTLILLYFPSLFLQVISSPIPISTIILLLSLLRLGQSQYSSSNKVHQPQQEQHKEEDPVHDEPDPEPEPTRSYDESFVEWDVRAPLEIIYEEHEEGEEADRNDDVFEEKNVIQRYASLSLYYPESDESDCSSEEEEGQWDSPEKMCFRWDDDDEGEYEYDDYDDRDGLIEIELDGDEGKKRRSNEVELEDNLIEIDIFPAS